MLLRISQWAVSMYLLFGAAYGLGTDIPQPNREARLMRELDALREQNGVAALGLVIVMDDRIGLMEVRGVASRELSEPIKADAIFRIGSISKMFAGLVAAELDVQEILSLNSPINSWDTQGTFSNQWHTSHPVTVAQLLEHTAGLEDMSKPEWDFSDPLQPPLRKTLRLFPAARQVKWQPGLHYSYTNAGAGLAGYVMEQATGETWEQLLEKRVFEPLGMANTSVFRPSSNRLARGYDKDGSTVLPYWYQIFRPFGAINSTLQDLGLFLRMLINRGQLDRKFIFPSAVIERIESPRTSLSARRGLAFGYGLGNYQWLHDGVLFHGHGGDADGYLSKLGYTLSNNSGYFLVITAFQKSTLGDMQKLVEKYLVEPQTPASSPTIARLSVNDIERITGDYQRVTRRFPRADEQSASPSMRIYTMGAQLFSHKSGGRPRPILPVTTELFRRLPEDRATFFVGRAADGHVYFQEDSDNFRKLEQR